MSTYLQGVTDYIPQIQQFQPDFNFYSKSMQMSQSKYDANHDKLSSLYGSLLNSPMLRTQNIEQRDQFFKTIDQDIKRMSGMDLSKQQNIDSASAVFNQMLDNKNIVKDMVWTKNWQKEHQRADGFRNCVDPEKCGGSWWEGGVTALNYQADEFKNASDDQAMNFGNAKFTPYQDVMGKAMAMAKEADLNVSIDKLTGGYIVTTKNGPNIVKPLYSMFMGSLGNDPAIKEYYKTKAYVDRKSTIQSMIPAYGSLEAAQDAYINQAMQTLDPKIKADKDGLGFTQANIGNERQRLEKKIAEEGTHSGSKLLDVYNQMRTTEAEVNSSLETVNEASGNLDVVKRNKQMLSNLDNALATGYLQNDIGKAAETMAYKDYEVSRKANPFALENVRQSNRLTLEKVKFGNKAALTKYGFDLKQFAKKQEARGDATANNPLSKDVITGGYSVSEDPDAAFKAYQKDVQTTRDNISAPEKEIVVSAMKLTQERSRTSAGIANEDLVKVMDAVMTEFGDVNNYKDEGGANVGIGSALASNAELARYKNMNRAQKLKFAQNFDFNKLEKLNGSVIDNIYNDQVLPLFDQNNPTNEVSRNYLNNLWKTSAQNRDKIQSKQSYLDQSDKWFASEAQSVKQKMKANSEYDKVMPFIELYIDENGHKKTDKEFAKDYAQKFVDQAPPAQKKQVFKQAYTQGLLAYREEEESGDIEGMWKKGWSENVDPKGIPAFLGGAGSQGVSKQMVFPVVDPSEYMSNGTMATKGYLKDALAASDQDYKVTIAPMSAEIPESSSMDAKMIMQQINADLSTRTNPKDNKRPILQISYQDVAGGDTDWTAMNIKVDDAYASQYVGSAKNKGIFSDDRRKALQGAGITVYLKKSAANNLLTKNAKKTDLDNIMSWSGEVPIDSYPEVTKNLKVRRKDNGGLAVEGSVWQGINADTGQDIWKPVPTDNNDPMADVNATVESIRQSLNEISALHKYQREAWDNTHGTHTAQ